MSDEELKDKIGNAIGDNLLLSFSECYKIDDVVDKIMELVYRWHHEQNEQFKDNNPDGI